MYLAVDHHSQQVAPLWRGLGDASAAQQVAAYGSVAGGVITAAAAPAVATMLGISASLAVPIVGAVFAGVLIGVEAILNSGCGPSCVMTSKWAEDAEPLLRQNLDTYFQTGRTAFDHQSALNMFDAVWAGLVQRCSQPGLSTAGQNCIADRQAGACKWKADRDQPYGGPRQGECFNWFNAYRDPIAHDPVRPDPPVNPGGQSAESALGLSPGSNLVPLLAIGGLLALAVLT